MRIRHLSATLGFFGLLLSANARYGEGLWFLGEVGAGGLFVNSSQINPLNNPVNPGLKESNKNGYEGHLDTGASWYLSPDFVADATLGFLYSSVKGSATAGGQSVTIRHSVGSFTLVPRWRFGDLGRYQIGPEYRMLFGTDTSFTEREGQTLDQKPISHYAGAQFVYDMPSSTEKTLYRLGLEALTCLSEPRRIIEGDIFFQIAFDFFGDHRHYRREEPVDYHDEKHYDEPPIEDDLPPQAAETLPDEDVAVADTAPQVDANAVTVVATGSAVSIHFPSDRFLFATGMSHIGSKETRAYLHDLGVFLAKNQDVFQWGIIVGHTDRRGPKGREREVNLELSEARARTVYGVLVDAGVDPKKLKFEGKAFDQPV